MEQILVDLKNSLQEIVGDRMVKMVLYGSRARGDFGEDSDTDIAIVVRGLSREMKRQMLSGWPTSSSNISAPSPR